VKNPSKKGCYGGRGKKRDSEGPINSEVHGGEGGGGPKKRAIYGVKIKSKLRGWGVVGGLIRQEVKAKKTEVEWKERAVGWY